MTSNPTDNTTKFNNDDMSYAETNQFSLLVTENEGGSTAGALKVDHGIRGDENGKHN